jgi:hypothetical protein
MGRLIDKGRIKAKAAARRAARGETKAWIFDYKVGDLLKDESGAQYRVVELPDRPDDFRVTIRKMVIGAAGQPLGLYDGPAFRRPAKRDAVRLDGEGHWARRVPAEGAA